MKSTTTMPAAFLFGLLLWCLHHEALGAELAAPQNVEVVSQNTNYMLIWDWDQSSVAGVTFTTQHTAQFKLKSKKPVNWTVVCENKSHRSCDLTQQDLYYRGIYVIRVRANLGERHSEWVQKQFHPDENAHLGPPSKVELSPAGSVLDVVISDPLTSNNTSMKELDSELYYHIVYWEGSADTRASRVQAVSSSANLVTLPNLSAWTWYCVKVQSCSDYYNKSSSFTSAECRQTEGSTPWWQICLSFLGSLVVSFFIVLALVYGSRSAYKTIKGTFFPHNQLPSHFKEYLCDSPGSDIPRLLTPDSVSELLCETVIICPAPVLEIHNPPPEALQSPPSGLEPDSSGRHSRQGSSGSGDSGVYSTGGSNRQTSAGTEASWQGPFDAEKVKMQDMAPGLKSQPAVVDEGIVDVCV